VGGPATAPGPRHRSALGPSSRAAASERSFARGPAGSGALWKPHDWRNWRQRGFDRACNAVGLLSARPCGCAHSFASLLLLRRTQHLISPHAGPLTRSRRSRRAQGGHPRAPCNCSMTSSSWRSPSSTRPTTSTSPPAPGTGHRRARPATTPASSTCSSCR